MPLRVVPWNFVGRGYPASELVSQEAIDADYPLAHLYDGRTSPPCMWSDAATVEAADVTVPLNMIQEGSFEEGTLDAWTVATGFGTHTIVATTPYDGTQCLELDGAGGYTQAQQMVLVYASHAYEFRCALRGVSATAKVAVIDLEGGGRTLGGGGYRWLTALGAWSNSETWLGATAVDAWSTVAVQFTVPSYVEWGRISGRLLVLLQADDVGLFDAISLAPAVDTLAVIGHNLPSWATLGLYDGPDYSTATLMGSVAPSQPVSFVRLPALLYEPQVSVAAVWPTSMSAFRLPFMGELYLGQSIDLRTPRILMPTEWTEEQIRLAARGHVSTYRDAAYPQRNPTLALDFETKAQRDELRDEWMLATEFGSRPHLVLPATLAQPEACYFALVDPGYTEEHDHQDLYYHSEFKVREVPVLRHDAPLRIPPPAGEGGV